MLNGTRPVWTRGPAFITEPDRGSSPVRAVVPGSPTNVFRHDGDYIFALTCGPEVQWVEKVLAARTAQLEQRGRTVPLRDPPRFTDSKASRVPPVARAFLRFVRVREFPSPA